MEPPNRALIFSILSVLIIFLAISFKTTNFYRKAIIFPNPRLYQQFLKFLHFSPSNLNPNQQIEITEPPYCVLWMAPFLSGGGYSSEAWSYILAVNNYIKTQKKIPFLFKLAIEQHGDLENLEFWNGLSMEMRILAMELHQTQCRFNQTIVICHSEPGAWYPPLFETLPCPLSGYDKFLVVIGRTMFETDRVNAEHVQRCNKMDLVWVPTDFHVNAFIQSGVDPVKVRKIVQAVDFEFFDPVKVEPIDLASLGSNLVLGVEKSLHFEFVFLSIFKWEYRKGWDVLLRAYLKEFTSVDNVALYLLTNPYHSENDFSNKIVEYVENDSDLEEPVSGWPPVYVIDDHIPQVDLPRLYKAVDAFVLPSRGEGWGRPIVEAMTMALPVITTNWSGPTEYLRDDNSYPLSFEGLSEVEQGPFMGHLWAEPSVDNLRLLMRRIMSNPEEAKSRGMKARLDMIARFSPEVVAKVVIDNLHEIVERIGGGAEEKGRVE